MLSENLKRICSLLKQLDKERGKFMSYRGILKSVCIPPNELSRMLGRLEESGFLSCTGRDFWGDPRGYKLLKGTESISLLDLQRCTGMENLLFDGMEDPSGRLPAAVGRLQEELKTIRINEILLRHVYTKETENSYKKDGSGQD